MQIDDRVVTTIPPSVMRRNPRLKGLWVRRAAMKLLMGIRNKYMDEGIDIFNIFVRGATVEVTLRGDLDVSELTEMQKKNRAAVMKLRSKRENEGK